MKIWGLYFAPNKASRRMVHGIVQELRHQLWFKHHIPNFTEFAAIPAPPGSYEANANTVVTWTEPLISREAVMDVLRPHELMCHMLRYGWPNVVVTCRPQVAAVALGIKNVNFSSAKIVQIESPNDLGGHYNFKLRDFDLILAQPQEGLSGRNVITTKLALHDLTRRGIERTKAETTDLVANSGVVRKDHPLLAVMVGGSDDSIAWDLPMVTKLSDDIQALAAKNPEVDVAVLTSRRTGAEGTQLLKDRLHSAVPNAKVDELTDYAALVAHADSFIVTADSFSMPSEIAITGKAIHLHDMGGALLEHPLNPIFDKLVSDGMLQRFTPDMKVTKSQAPQPIEKIDERPALARQIISRLKLDSFARRSAHIPPI